MLADRELRGTGRTALKMTTLKKGSVYIWCNSDLSYPRELAKSIGRDDLIIVSPSWLSKERFRGRTYSGIGLDHALDMSPKLFRLYHLALGLVR